LAKNPYYDGPVSDHYDGLRFFPPGGPRDKALGELLKMVRDSRRVRVPWPKNPPVQPCPAPPVRVDGLRVTLVGHSTFLIQTQRVNILTDPVWSDRAGPFGLIGPKRATPPGLDFAHLPALDAILLSHNHYDHMDLATLSRLAKERPCPVWTPLGNDTILKTHDAGIDARALDWGQSAEIGALRVTCEPALHWSARGRSDRRMALWGSFMLTGAEGAIYYAGDTGYGDGSLWDAIAARHAPIRLALLPIGAYAPRWFMADQHCDPDEAVAIFQKMRVERAVACHWGAFRLTDEPYDEPPLRLAAALIREGIAADRFVAPPPGGVAEIG
jgi:L-ascorbate metabolism protein UlaG (beta-lactamase superfamily)